MSYVGQDSANDATPKEYTGLHHGYSRPVLITGDAGSISRMLDALKAWAVINAAGYVRVDDA